MAIGAALIGAVVSFVATRDSGDDIVASNPTSVVSTTAPSDPEQTTAVPAELGAERLSRSVVQIQLLLDGEPTCTGSGTVVDTTGTVVTNFHVVEQSPICPHDRIGIAIAESSQAIPTLVYEADLLTFDSELDLAVIRIARDLSGVAVTEQFEPIELGDSDAVSLGDQIRVIGYPGIGGETVTFTTGSVSGFAETPEGGQRSWLKTDATITGGNSGGLAADAAGRFVGIPTRAGSGSGQIVDCRVIADSNGDGRLDSADSCVPIGGFINGIRPVALAVPLIEAAATAEPIDQGPPEREAPMNPDLPEASNPTWTSALTDDGVATDQLAAAPAGIPEVCLTWDFANVPVGSLSDAIWLIDGESIPEASVLDDENEAESSGSFFACISRDDGLLAGTYELAWLVDEELVFAEAIILDEGSTALVEVLNSTDVPLCVVQFNPNGTSTYGLNELTETVEPGQSITVEVAVGPLDARIIDCDGDIRIEDSSGFVVDGDLLVTVD
ncbi:MAG: S1 family peptidase [Acidimicrobiales bacterium]